MGILNKLELPSSKVQVSTGAERGVVKEATTTIILIPHPSSDPSDPLNWPLRKKYWFLFIICFASFSAALAPTAHQQAYLKLVPLYHQTNVALSYSVVAAVAGFLGGPLLIAPLAQIFGRTSCILWCLFGTLICQIWAASMTNSNDYIPFVLSRWICGMFASVPVVLGPAYFMDIFFLHQRGRAFASLELSMLLGVSSFPTIGGFIVQNHPWPVVFWWTLGPIVTAILLVFFFLKETGFCRDSAQDPIYPKIPSGFFKNRLVTFLPGTKVVPEISLGRVLQAAIVPLQIALSPVGIIPGVYTFFSFGFTIMVNIQLTIYLQTPESRGGYGFSSLGNASFTFCVWMGVFAAQATGWLLGDRLPLWASKRRGGRWHPEYRLLNMLLPGLLGPIGLGMMGAALQYHLHYMVLAVGFFLVTWGATLVVPICTNYVVECFISTPIEVAVAINTWRHAFAVALGFFVTPWRIAVGAGWQFGTAAFLDLFALVLIGVLGWKGASLRGLGIKKLQATEDGEFVSIPHGNKTVLPMPRTNRIRDEQE